MNIKHLLGASALAASIALGAVGSASALVYEQLYTGTVALAVDGGLFGGLSGGEAFTVRFVTDTDLGSGIVDGPDGQTIEGGSISGASAPVTAFITINGYTESFIDNIVQSRSQIFSSGGQLDVANSVVYQASGVGELNILAGAAGVGSGLPATFGQSYALSSPLQSPTYLIVLGTLNDRGVYFEMTVTSASGGVISAVPEPATWALMMSGFAVLGGALRVNRGRQHVTA
ncbi:MAG: PEPxxWA-CTERM sorting domain-containing protein [Alphaproteobacteria bacterium]|nr:PEPxxWA-CTERM sorting domain-containing protein [Alphaproteobacteria bacterium]MBU1515543.1 PEPxxWA-CTERM sorting domain-containing protein [Alphaproteobacteria bacterium]MBU2095541.1 PEPxxWA-CTERM sorting domain-containing protein [Alphaproteobacteria bacterium]MBU2150782.1 PEPxxWA-CTERM sorting domain-containing protein [Alphaproteobacteria bacterium]MBU2307047.1 PEPxxWA-CTERM sorting domain-containing protein [Alphaproteobacteria bacterium]